jgi:hypothetical protein
MFVAMGWWRAKVYTTCGAKPSDLFMHQKLRQLGVKNLVLYHTEDRNLERRKELYLAEGKSCFNGMLWVPDDLDSIEL